MQGRQYDFLVYGNNSNGSIEVGILSFFSGTFVAMKCKAARSQRWKNLFLCISEIIAIKSPFLIEYSLCLLINCLGFFVGVVFLFWFFFCCL